MNTYCPPVITFVGWHNEGKTTVASRVVNILKKRGIKLAVVKSSKETGLSPNTPGTDTDTYLHSGADAIMLATPDTITITTSTGKTSLTDLATTYFSTMEIVIGEGFKHEKGIAKIEVNHTGQNLLWNDDPDVIALVSDTPPFHPTTFASVDYDNIAQFIINNLLATK